MTVFNDSSFIWISFIAWIIFFRSLNIKENKFKDFQINEVFAAIQSNIEKLDMSGKQNDAVNLKNFSKLVK